MNGRGARPTLLGDGRRGGRRSGVVAGLARRRVDRGGERSVARAESGTPERHRRIDEALERARRSASAEERQVQDSDPGARCRRACCSSTPAADRVRERALERHLGARPTRSPRSIPPACARAVRASRRTEQVGSPRSRPARPTRWLRATATPAGERRRRPARDRRRHRGAPPRRRPARLRRERLPRAEDARGVDPGGGRDDPARLARRPGGGAPLRGAAGARGAAALAHRRRPARPLAAGVGQRARRTGSTWTPSCARRSRFEERGARGRPRRWRSTPPRCRRCAGSARDLALLVRNLIDNAIRYTRRAAVSVAVGRRGRRIGRR